MTDQIDVSLNAGPFGGGDFLVKEGLDLLSAFRRIKSDEARRAIILIIAAIAQAESDAEERAAV